MNKNLSWKLLLPLGLIVWLIGKVFQESIIGDAIALLGFIMLALGVVGAISALVKRKNDKEKNVS